MEPTSEEHVSPQVTRRKACDLCFKKKIKCDMLQPICSNCLLYKANCTTTLIRRKPNPAKVSKSSPPLSQQAKDQRAEAMEARLGRMEEQLQLVLDVARNAQQTATPRSCTTSDSTTSDEAASEAALMPAASTAAAATGTTTTAPPAAAPPAAAPAAPAATDDTDTLRFRKPRVDDTLDQWRFDPVNPSEYAGPGPETLPLPPLEDILPVVDRYFTTFNGVIPLFDQPKFMKVLYSWYHNPEERDRIHWSAIHVVLAIGHRTPSLRANTQTVQIAKADESLRNAQTVVSELVTRDQDLLGVQILLGIVMLFQNSRNPRPAAVLIGTAVRLAYRLRLHAAHSAQFFTPEETKERSNVFWIAYTLDKDLCLRTQTPSCLMDEDIDVPLPPAVPSDSQGFIWTQNGQSYFNYHRKRTELAHIQGKVYDLLYSNRAGRITPAERQRRVLSLQMMLDKWYDGLPAVFHIENVASTVGPSELVQLTKMHHAYLLAEVVTHSIYSSNADWIQKLSSLSRASLESLERNKNGAMPPPSCSLTTGLIPPLPEGWKKCVEVSRGCMKLFQEATPTECLIWQCFCSHVSAMIVLLAQMILHPLHQFIAFDQLLVLRALDLFDKMLEVVVDDEDFKLLRSIAAELSQRADFGIEAARMSASNQEPNVFEGLDLTESEQDLDFLPLSSEVDELHSTFGFLDQPLS